MSSKQESVLPPLDFTEEIELYDAKHEKKELVFKTCPHKEVRIENGWLKCKCGNNWQGTATQLSQLYQLLISR